ncbi:MAG: hypothetical protein HY280_04040 [Nitrospinae bacterium]|nr:hypothetical protein [Nitrospinota bacterium]
MRLAQLYAGDPLLKELPVPCFRLPAIKLSIPVAVSGITEPQLSAHASSNSSVENLLTVFRNAVATESGVNKLFDDKTLSAYLQKIGGAFKPFYEKQGRQIYAVPFTDGLVAIAREALPKAEKPVAQARQKDFLNSLRQRLVAVYIPILDSNLPRLEVEVSSTRIRDEGLSELAVRLELNVSESGVEWSWKEDAKGDRQSKLVAE